MNSTKSINKTFLVSNLKELLIKNKNKWLPYSLFNEKIAIKLFEDELNDINILKIWKTNTLFDYGYESFTFSNFILFLCYTKKYKSIKIEALNINEKNLKTLNELNEIYEIVKLLINFLKKNCNKYTYE